MRLKLVAGNSPHCCCDVEIVNRLQFVWCVCEVEKLYEWEDMLNYS